VTVDRRGDVVTDSGELRSDLDAAFGAEIGRREILEHAHGVERRQDRDGADQAHLPGRALVSMS
jgi:hypothetical protein